MVRRMVVRASLVSKFLTGSRWRCGRGSCEAAPRGPHPRRSPRVRWVIRGVVRWLLVVR